jgi:hypothetical protein
MVGRIKSYNLDQIVRCFNLLHRDRAETPSSEIRHSIFSDLRRGRETMASISYRFNSSSPDQSVNDISSISRPHSINLSRAEELYKLLKLNLLIVG